MLQATYVATAIALFLAAANPILKQTASRVEEVVKSPAPPAPCPWGVPADKVCRVFLEQLSVYGGPLLSPAEAGVLIA